MTKRQKKAVMAKRNFSRITKNIFVLLALLFLLGFGTAFILIDPMKYVIQFEDNVAVPEITNEVPEVLPERELMPNASLISISTIVIGQNNSHNRLYNKIASDLQTAIYNRTDIFIPIQNDTALASLTNNSVVIGNSQMNRFSEDLMNLTVFLSPTNWTSGSFFIRGVYNFSSNFRHVLIYGNNSQGDSNAVYWLIDQ
jgi:hypothetical protein